MLETTKYVRKQFPVDAVRVTAENMDEVAAWCHGEVDVEKTPARGGSPEREDKFVKVRVHRPLTDRQTKAFIGDWVLYAGTGFKVYTDKAFNKSFEMKDAGTTMQHTEQPGDKSFRDAVTGEYVTEEYALAHPDTTVSEKAVLFVEVPAQS